MVWFKVDDGFYDHPKFLDVPNAAIGLWAKAGAWCSRHLTDGVIPASQVTMLRGTKSQVNALISTGIWRHSETESGAKAYAFHGWNEYQPTRGQVEKDRAESAERQRKSRERKRDEQEQSENVTRDSQTPVTRDSHESHKGVSQRPGPTRPDPTRPYIDQGSQPTYGDHARETEMAGELNLDDLAAATRRARTAGISEQAITQGTAEYNKRPEPKGPGLLRTLINDAHAELTPQESKSTQRASRRAAIDACEMCDSNGMRIVSGNARRCNHQTPPF